MTIAAAPPHSAAGPPGSPALDTPLAHPAPAPDSIEVIGQAHQPIRALAFAGGAYDTAMQLGLVHALLVSRATPPDLVVGLSAGAINAAALAEVLQAGEGLPDDPRLEAQVARFREILERFRAAPGEIINGYLPDLYQLDAAQPLEPVKLPIHMRAEREERTEAVRSRAGLIRLINDLLALDVGIHTITRVTRAALGLRATGDEPCASRRWLGRTIELWRLWRVVGLNLWVLAPIGWRLLQVLISPAPSFKSRRNETSSDLESAPGPHGASAGELIFRSRLRRHVGRTAARIVGWFSALSAWGILSIATALSGIGAAPAIARLPGPRAALAIVARPLAALGLCLGLVLLAAGLVIVLPVTVVWLLLRLLAAAGKLLARTTGRRTSAREAGRPVGGMRAAGPAPAPRSRRRSLGYRVLGWYALRFQRWYGIADGLLDPHLLRELLVRVFDPTYYGKPKFDDIVESALARRDQAHQAAATPKRLADYADRQKTDRPIHVGPIAADVRTGLLRVLPPATPVVDALLAACALPPLFEAQAIPRKSDDWMIDGSAVANEPTDALLDRLRTNAHPEATEALVYPVTSLPLTKARLQGPDREYSGLVDILLRARRLKRFRDARLARGLTHLITRAMPPGPARQEFTYRAPDGTSTTEPYVRAWVVPIEPEEPLDVNTKVLLAADTDARRRCVLEAVADGCRATLETLLQPDVAALHAVAPDSQSYPCRSVIRHHLDQENIDLPSSSPQHGPGVSEVCRVCALARGCASRAGTGGATTATKTSTPAAYRLRLRDAMPDIEPWPTIGENGKRRVTPPATAAAPPRRPAGERAPSYEITRPTVSFLFSGGVFRGVYLSGVVTALSELGLQPDVIAGSSVGSITAAMTAQVFAQRGQDRARALARVAATFLAIDRLVLTDRFADFIRTFTLRAGASRFSIRQLDGAFRAFDRASPERFNREFRHVLAGLERLLYVNPFEARDLIEALRRQENGKALQLARNYLQEWLQRGGVEVEILGAEPLARLIAEHALAELPARGGPETARLMSIGGSRIRFLCTATDLTQGHLVILGASDDPKDDPRLLDALLASSAFPAVFRPRWGWEVFPRCSELRQYIDGGVIDNLPLDAVTSYLYESSLPGRARFDPRPRVEGRPVPHLAFTASLEVERAPLTEQELDDTVPSWYRVRQRARELSYNNKIETYALLQRAIRTIHDDCGRRGIPTTASELVDLEVVAVKPKWLCGTFGFHPMLGFRRAKQAASIAHGCASTLGRFHALLRDPKTRPWALAWGVKPEVLGDPATMDRWPLWPSVPPAAAARTGADGHPSGKCWFRPDRPCPFHRAQVQTLGVEPRTMAELHQIHVHCGRPETHLRQ